MIPLRSALRLIACLAFAGAAFVRPDLRAQSSSIEQSQIEAAMMLQILSFTEWPAPKLDDSRSIDIGVYESPESLAAFEALVEDPRFRGRFTIHSISANTDSDSLKKLEAVYFAENDPVDIPRLILRVQQEPIVLAGAFEGFLENGGMVNLTKRQRKIGFEIDLNVSRERGIEFRAKLLRLATRVIE